MIKIARFFIIAILLSILAVFLAYGLQNILMPEVFNSIHDGTMETIYKWNIQGAAATNHPRDFTIIDIDYKTCALLGRKPTHRDIATGIAKIAEMAPAGIILDIAMDYPENGVDDSSASRIFSTTPDLCFTGVFINNRDHFPKPGIDSPALKTIDKFALPFLSLDSIYKIDADYISVPLSIFLKNDVSFGFASCSYDRNCRLTTVPLFYKYKNKTYPSVLLSYLSLYYDAPLAAVRCTSGVLSIGKQRIPVEKTGFRFIPQGPDQFFTTIPFYRIGSLNRETIEGKTILIGRSVPNNDFHSVRSKNLLFGTEIMANALYCIIHKIFTKKLSSGILILICFFAAFPIVIISISRFYLFAPMLYILVLLIALLTSMTLLENNGYEFDPVTLFLSASIAVAVGFLWQIIILKRDRNKTRST